MGIFKTLNLYVLLEKQSLMNPGVSQYSEPAAQAGAGDAVRSLGHLNGFSKTL